MAKLLDDVEKRSKKLAKKLFKIINEHPNCSKSLKKDKTTIEMMFDSFIILELARPS
jgi:hypothetical protein